MTETEQYLNKRRSLISEEHALRFDAGALSKATSQEIRAADIVRNLKDLEAKEVWSSESEKLMYPGMEFLVAKETIEHPNMHIRVPTAITSASPLPAPDFEALTPNVAAVYEHEPSLTSSNYKPGAWVLLSRARREFELGGVEAFDKWIVGSMMINPGEAYAEFNTSAKIWTKFQSTFAVTESIMRHRPIAKAYMRQVMLSSVEDGVSHLEIRFGFPRFGIFEDGSKSMEHRDWLIIFDEAVNEVKAIVKGQGRGDDFIGAKIIYTALRFLTNEQMTWYYQDCMNLKKEFPHVVAGFDLVGHEDTGRPLIYYAESLLNFQAESKRRGLDIPFVFHAGETLDDGGVTDSNLYDAILLGTKRIGHGHVKHPFIPRIVWLIYIQVFSRQASGAYADLQGQGDRNRGLPHFERDTAINILNSLSSFARSSQQRPRGRTMPR
ncbi:hypothetical protein FRC09_000613 [Ceratobasidium sp. 395]|nr:hypothetical protein FRC09_000613 [Ceratobasidium sp. 395]